MGKHIVQTIDVYEFMYRYYLKHNKYPTSRIISREFKVSQISILKHRRNIEKFWRAKKIGNDEYRTFKRDFKRELSGGANDVYINKIDVLQNRVKELEETLGSLMRKNWILKLYKGTKLIYQVDKKQS